MRVESKTAEGCLAISNAFKMCRLMLLKESE